MPGGGRFSRYVLDTGSRTTPAWGALQRAGTDAFAAASCPLIDERSTASEPNAPATENQRISPIPRLLGWHLLPRQSTKRRGNIPDALLFADPTALREPMRARRRPDRCRHATIVREQALGAHPRSRHRHQRAYVRLAGVAIPAAGIGRS